MKAKLVKESLNDNDDKVKRLREGDRVIMLAIEEEGIPLEKGIILDIDYENDVAVVDVDHEYRENDADDGIREVSPISQIIKESIDEISLEKSNYLLSTEQSQAVSILENIGMRFVSTFKQIKNGTLFFDSPYHRYSISKSGYARVHYGEGTAAQLNPKNKNVGLSVELYPNDYVKLANIIKKYYEKNKSDLGL